jgi:hypothetical protein
MSIPQEAIGKGAEAMVGYLGLNYPPQAYEGEVEATLEAAYSILLSHEVEQTRLAHLDAMVNAQTVSTLEAKLDALRSFADEADDHGISPSDIYKILDGDA